ncbi:hypothetical protein [Rhizobium sp. R693]|uniref:hypothetical protein n=1 Tax=Rhizobium sp. R693 TaxID=1764276 RepID=UPI001130A05D|nr:hypothetical protein [Rhizobium sp. R693]
MSVRFITAFLKSSGDCGIVVLESDGEQRTVIVDRQALLNLATPPRADECRLQQSVGQICEIAAAKLTQRKLGPFERIEISGSDVETWNQRQAFH